MDPHSFSKLAPDPHKVLIFCKNAANLSQLLLKAYKISNGNETFKQSATYLDLLILVPFSG
jgi:hypothetical protein